MTVFKGLTDHCSASNKTLQPLVQLRGLLTYQFFLPLQAGSHCHAGANGQCKQLPGRVGSRDHQQKQSDQGCAEAEPDEKNAGDDDFQYQQHSCSDQPVPVGGENQLQHYLACVFFSSSVMPATAPVTPEASSGIRTSLLLSPWPMCCSASTYLTPRKYCSACTSPSLMAWDTTRVALASASASRSRASALRNAASFSPWACSTWASR